MQEISQHLYEEAIDSDYFSTFKLEPGSSHPDKRLNLMCISLHMVNEARDKGSIVHINTPEDPSLKIRKAADFFGDAKVSVVLVGGYQSGSEELLEKICTELDTAGYVYSIDTNHSHLLGRDKAIRRKGVLTPDGVQVEVETEILTPETNKHYFLQFPVYK